jgi:hypothetical protein
LQYADDTLIIMRADVCAAARLKHLLGVFAEATGLVINFHKSTLVPMHVAASDLAGIQASLGCRVEGFLQTYLGLPLSCEKLTLANFAVMIAKVDKYLSGWCALLLSSAGRIVLLNAVLDALPTFAMGALELPPALLRAIEALRRAFLWNAADWPSGAKCLVAWDAVCHPKHEGGLGIKSLAAKNECLQLKLVHRLHSRLDAAWPRWAWSEAAAHATPGHHWRHLVALVPLYHSISVAVVGDGCRTAFWLDCWLGGVRWPVLLSHALDAEATVAVLQSGVR